MNPILRQLFTLLLFIFSNLLFAQNPADSVKNVPELIKKNNYKEFTTFDKNHHFEHTINYNEPGSVDEEYSFTLAFVFTDFDNIKPAQIINLKTDTAIVHCSYDFLSVWSWFDNKSSFSGTITIISKSRKKVVIEENIRVRDNEGKILIYKGRKTFVRRKGN